MTRKDVEKWEEKRDRRGLGVGFWRGGEVRVLEEVDLERRRRQAMENDFWRWIGKRVGLDLMAVIGFRLGDFGRLMEVKNFMEIQKNPTCRIRTSDLRMATRISTHYSPPLYQLS